MTTRKPKTLTQSPEKAAAGPDRRRVLAAAAAGTAAGILPGSAAGAAEHDAPSDHLLEGQSALVTGAARGIGRAIAVAFAKAGADVALLDIADATAYRETLGYALGSEAELEESAALVEAEGRKALRLKADVTDLEAMKGAVAQTLGAFGSLDIAVANAGVSAGGPLQTLAPQRWNTVVDINLTGVAHTLMTALPHMIERGSGRIITVTSVLGRQATDAAANYVASKWGVVGLTKAAAIDAGPHGVTVNAIAPTGVRTAIFGALAESPERMAAIDKALQGIHPLPVGFLEPEDIAGAAVFLASPAAAYISGAVIDVAAGQNARYTA